MLKQQPKQLVAHNEILQWEEYNEQVAERQLVQVSDDSTLIITCEFKDTNNYYTLRIWDSQTFKIVGRRDSSNDDLIIAIDLSPNNKWIMLRTAFEITLLETMNLHNEPLILNNQYYHSTTAIFSQDSKYVIFGKLHIRMYNIQEQTLNSRIMDCGDTSIQNLKCNRHLLICTQQNRILVWNSSSQLKIHHWLQKDWIFNVSLSSNQTQTVVTVGKVCIKMWSIQTRKLIRKYGKSQSSFGYVNLSPNGQLMISNQLMHECLLWNLMSGECIAFEKSSLTPCEYKFTPDGKFIIRISIYRRVKIWNFDSDQYFKMVK